MTPSLKSMLWTAAPLLGCVAMSAAAQVVGDGACPKYALDIAAFATCEGERVVRPGAVVPRAEVAASKMSSSAQHLTAPQAYELLNSSAQRAVLVDVRSRLEVALLGAPDGVTVHLPYQEPVLPLQWEAGRRSWAMARNFEFGARLMTQLAARGFGPDTVVVFLCTSGERSARAADELADFGYPVVTVIDGFEGDLGADRRRSVNGWKNAGLPWTASATVVAAE